MAKAIAVTKLGVVGGTVYNVGNYVLEATIADAVVAAGLATITQADVPDDIDLSTPEAILNAMGDTPSLVIVSASVTTKPSSPNEKDVYIVPAGSAWAALDEAYDNQLALFERGGWKYITPKFGWQVRNKADNGVLWYDGDSWEVSGSGGGSGTVTSVGLSLPNIFTISGSPVTTSGTLAATLANQSANQFLGGPSSGGGAAPGFRSLVLADIPDISSVYATKAYADGLVVGLLDDRGNFDASSNTFPAAGGSGSGGAVLKGDLWTISVAGTLGGTAVTPGDIVRALVDTPGQTASNWAVSETNIGYAALNAALNSGQIYIGNGSNVGTARTFSGDVTINNTGVTSIGNGKVTNAMLAGSIDLTAKVTGALPVANGGTGLSALGSALQVLRVNSGGTALEYAAAGGGVALGDSPTWTGAHSFSNTITQTSNSAAAFESGPNGSTNPVFRLVNSVISAATGLSVTGNAAGSGVTLTALSSGTNENVIIAPKGSGATIVKGSGTLYFDDTNGFIQRTTVSGTMAFSPSGGSVQMNLTGSRLGVGTSDTSSSGYTANFFLLGLAAASGGAQQTFWIGASAHGGNGGGGHIVVVSGGAGSTATTGSVGGDLMLLGGVANGTGNNAGGNLYLLGGSKTGSGSDGNIYLGYNGTTARGNVHIGNASTGTSGVGVLAIANGTAPGSSPADTGQIYAADWNGAGTSAIHVRNEEGHIIKICSQAVAALTNNVTSGGTNDQISNWTDLTTYATDAAAIRNAIFQLSRKLAEVVTAQRTNGLFR